MCVEQPLLDVEKYASVVGAMGEEPARDDL